MKGDYCETCGSRIINGICLNCGDTAEHPGIKPIDGDKGFRFDLAPSDEELMADVEIPEIETIDGMDIEPPVSPADPDAKLFDWSTSHKDNVNPYSNVIPFESPDYGNDYSEPDYVVYENGIPKKRVSSDTRNQTLSQRIKLKPDKTLLSCWWIILLAALLPGFVCSAIGVAMLKFDEKGGREAGKIILLISIPKIIIESIISGNYN